MKIAYNVTAGEGKGPEMCSGCRVCLFKQPYTLSSCVPWKTRPKSAKKILSECDARSEMHSTKDWIFQKSTSQSCRDCHAVCKNAQILSYVTKRDLKL